MTEINSESIGITDIEKVFSQLEEDAVSIYTNEFDQSMIRIFFPSISCKMGYLPNSCAFVNTLTSTIASIHKISVSRTKLEDPDIFSDIKKEGLLYIHTLKNDPLHVDEELENNKLVDCSYIESLFYPGNIKPLQITTTGIYSITSAVYSRQLCNLIKKKGISPTLILDSTACVGGDTLGFAKYLKCKVISIEKDPVNFGALQNNIEAFNLEDKVRIFQGDFLTDGDKLINEFKPDVIYFDPPWGGKDYSIKKDIELFLSDKNVKDIVSHIFSTYYFVNCVIIKVPLNFNSKNISKSSGLNQTCYTTFNFDLEHLKKFDLIFFRREIPTPSIKFFQTIMTPDYPMSIWVPEEKSKRNKFIHGNLYNMEYKNIHWGQRKLHMSEMDFFTTYTNRNDAYTVVYAGAANGQHIPLLLKLFPNLDFHLYDPAPFSPVVLEHPSLKINLYKDSVLPVGFFTDEIAAKYTNVKNLLFICDIRLAPSMKKTDPEYAQQFEKKVDYDMNIQKNWVDIMKPEFSILKMRIPYHIKEDYEYLDGDVRFQIWAPVASTETRLIVKKGSFSKKYIPEIYENQCAYFNNQMRQMDISNITFKIVGIDIDGKFKDLWMEYGIFINIDCYLETVVFISYLKRTGEEITILNIKKLIDETSNWLYNDVLPQNSFLKKIELNKYAKKRVE